MKVLLLNGEKNINNTLFKYKEIIKQNLKERNYETETILLREKEIASCTGCFGCWVKTPGICVIDDYAREIARSFINSDLVIFLTPVVFGGYSYQLKKALDRMIPLISPFFMVINGEVHHRPRYKKYPSLIGVGIMSGSSSEEQIEVFNKLIYRNTLNMHSQTHGSEVLLKEYEKEEMYEKIDNLLYRVVGHNE